MVGLPPSASVAEAEQVKVELVVTPVAGLMETLAITGSVLTTLTEAVAESVAPEPSVAVAVQAMVSDGEAVAVLRVKLALVPSVLVPLVHLYVIVGVPPSASAADAEQVSVDLVVTPVEGLTFGPDMTGAVLEIVTLSLPVGPSPPSTSVAVTTTSHESPEVVAL
jgi:hypothetical protein